MEPIVLVLVMDLHPWNQVLNTYFLLILFLLCLGRFTPNFHYYVFNMKFNTLLCVHYFLALFKEFHLIKWIVPLGRSKYQPRPSRCGQGKNCCQTFHNSLFANFHVSHHIVRRLITFLLENDHKVYVLEYCVVKDLWRAKLGFPKVVFLESWVNIKLS